MDTSAESATGKSPRPAKTRKCADGLSCPKNTYLRYSSKARDYVYYTKIKVRGVESDENTGILESTSGSRDAVIQWVAQRSRELLDAQYERSNELLREARESEHGIVITEHSRRWLSNITRLELARYDLVNGEDSPAYITVVKRLNRLMHFFGHECDVSAITRSDISRYVKARRSTKFRGRTVTWGTIRRELALLKSGVAEANKEGIFDPPLTLPIDSAQFTRLVAQDPVNERQRSHQYSEEDCEAWVEAAKGTSLEHIVYVAWKTGMRSAELQALQWGWIHPAPRGSDFPAIILLPEYLYKITKLDPRPIPLSVTVYEYLKALAVGKRPDERLLSKVHNATTTCHVVSRRCKRTFESIDVNAQVQHRSTYITLRDLRASAGRRCYDRCSGRGEDPLFATMHFLRHRDVKTTTKHYVRLSSRELSQIAKSMD